MTKIVQTSTSEKGTSVVKVLKDITLQTLGFDVEQKGLSPLSLRKDRATQLNRFVSLLLKAIIR